MEEQYKLYNGDCLEVMKDIKDKSIDMILCDLPYGTTICKWDVIIPFDELWKQYNRIIKDNGAILLFGTEPFSSKLRCSNLKNYKYDWVWYKSRAFNFFNAKKQPLKYHEIISVFYKKQPQYYPIMRKGEKNHRTKSITRKSNLLNNITKGEINTSDMKYPKSIIEIKSTDSTKNLHPTQKPVALLEYLIKTYTTEKEIVLDNCMGSGSTGIACLNTNRRFIGIEKDDNYFEIAKKRMGEWKENVSR